MRAENSCECRIARQVKYVMATQVATVAMQTSLDPPGNMLANGALVKPGGPILRPDQRANNRDNVVASHLVSTIGQFWNAVSKDASDDDLQDAGTI